MGDHIEAEAEGKDIAAGVAVDAGFQEAVAHGGVFETPQDRKLQAVEAVVEMPFDLMPEIALPDVQSEADHTIEVSRLELRGPWGQVVEMPLGVRKGGTGGGAPPGEER